MSRPTDTYWDVPARFYLDVEQLEWTSMTRVSLEQPAGYELLHTRPEDHWIDRSELQAVTHYDSEYAVRIEDMNESRITDWDDNP